MLYPDFKNDKEYLFGKFRNPEFDPSTGIDLPQLREEIIAYAQQHKTDPRPIVKGRCFELICRRMKIDVNPHDCFPGFGCYLRYDRPISSLILLNNQDVSERMDQEIRKTIDERNQAGLHTMWRDFDHSVPDWDAVLALGFPGLRKRAQEYRIMHEKNGTLDERAKAYFEGIDITLNSVLECIGRFIDFAKQHHKENPRIQREIEVLEQMRSGAPRNTYEVLMSIYLYFMFSEHIDHMQVRSLGNLDVMVYPYYRKDLDDGRFTMEEIREFICCFYMQWASINNYWGQPVYFGGTASDGSTLYNELSYLLLEIFDELSIPTPKIQLKIAKNTPEKLLDTALNMIRRGNNSLVFVSEENIWRSFMGMGYDEETARTCDIVGCYEPRPRVIVSETVPAHVNFLKAVELALNDGIDPKTGYVCKCDAPKIAGIKTFPEFYSACLKYLDNLIETVIICSNEDEKELQEINPSQILSSTLEHSLKTARDGFACGNIHNTSMILLGGIGTMVDALIAVKELVYETKQLTLEQLRDILNNNWKGHEKLRLKMRHSKRKFGNGIPEIDQYAQAIMHFAACKVNLRPNGRNGFYEAGGHCAKQYIEQGKRTGATPDGRLAGEEFSKNLSPTMGTDTEGVTAMIRSVTSIDSMDLPGCYPLDVMMHPTSVQGEEGLQVMKTLIRSYMEARGVAIQFNIFDAAVLEDAQKHPEKYAGLQIRVCGWNTHFTTMCKEEQDAYIERARRIAE